VKILLGGRLEHHLLQKSKYLNFSNIVTVYPAKLVSDDKISTKLLKDNANVKE